ncbi:MAG: hypothetical protein Q9216_001232 [Gyalolechia sp. 2 TL-2023]
MPLQTVSFRPQTSHQARRSYQKAGGAPRLSEIEQRRLERSAQLEERAAKIRAHDNRARENKRKRAEKLEKERETRKRMGISEPTKIKISSSQLSLGTFVKSKTEIRGEGTQSSKGYVKEETPACVPGTCSSPAYCVSNSNPPEHLKFEQQRPNNCTPPPSSQRSMPHQIIQPPSEDKKASCASLMPPPRSRAPLRKTAANITAHPGSKQQKNDLSTMIGNDWDSLFDSNTQVEREISGYKEKSPAQYSTTKLNPDIQVKSLPMVPLDLLADISTQDLQYSSSPPSPVKDSSNEVPNLPNGYINRLPPNGLHQSKESTIVCLKQRPSSSLSRDELDVIIAAVLNMYCLRLSLPATRRLISGQRLNGDGSIVAPRLVTLMAIKIEEERLLGKPTPMPTELLQWATSMQETEVKRERPAATARAGTLSDSSKTANSCRNIAPQNPRATDSGPLSVNGRIATSKSFDEFDDFDLSTQDLRAFDV